MTGDLELAARAYDEDGAEYCVRAGFRRLEIALPLEGGEAEEKVWADFARREGVLYLGHGPKEGDPRDVDRLAEQYLPRLFDALDAAARLGVSLLTVHMWMESRFLSGEIIDRKMELLQKAFEYGREKGVLVHLENLSESSGDLGRALDRIPGLFLTLDLGHAQLLTEENASFRIIEQHHHRIGHLHLHDNLGGDGPSDDIHMTPGRGIVPFRRIFSLLKRKGYRGAATIENLPRQIAEAERFVRKAWAEAVP